MKIVRIATLIAVLAGLLLLASGPGTRLGLWDFRTGISLMRWAVYAGLAGAGLGALCLLVPRLRRGQAAWLACAVALGLGLAYGPWQAQRLARSVPPIHDITTDTLDPPAFVAILPLRADAPNPPEYAGAETAEQQRAAYPELQPLRLELAPAQAFQRAEAAARSQGWEIVAVEPLAGRIEATATTLWFGFKDDVVIRVRGSDGASVVDLRSKSRVGRSDVGANAARIRAYLDELRKPAP
jgi:uncharacterized protein (DUF1499 family)